MRLARSWIVRVFVVLISLLPAGATAALAQPATPVSSSRPGLVKDGDYESPQFGTKVTWTSTWTVGDPDDDLVAHAIGGLWNDSVASDPGIGDALFLSDSSGTSSVISIGISPNQVSMNQYFPVMEDPGYLSNNLFMSPDANVLLIDNDGSEYAEMLARDAAPNENHAIYVVIRFPKDTNDPIVSFGIDLYKPANYVRDLKAAVSDLTIEGLDLFTVFSRSDVLDALTAPATASKTPTPVTSDADRKKLPTGGGKKVATPESATPVSATPVAGGDFPGLVGEGKYESPQYGDAIEWGDSWVISDIVDDPITTDPVSGLDSVLLTDARTERSVLYITVEPGDFDADALLATFADPGYQADVLGLDDGEVLLSDSTSDSAAVLLRGTTGGVSIAIMLEVRATDTPGTLSYVDLRATGDDFNESLLDDVQGDFSLDGTAGLNVFTTREVLDALAS